MVWPSCTSAGKNSRPVSRTIMRPCSSRSQPVLTHGYSEKPVFTSLPGVPQMRCLPVWASGTALSPASSRFMRPVPRGTFAAIDLPVLDYVAPRMPFDI